MDGSGFVTPARPSGSFFGTGIGTGGSLRSNGAAHSGHDFDEPDELVRPPDAAMYRARRTSGTDVHVFDPDQDRELTERH